jgi:GNAT superfamily N-acetyltransferase
MITLTTVSNNDELEQIIQLSRKNLRTNISPDEKQKEGFITWEYNKQLLQQLHALAPSVIAKENDEVIGYAITTLLAAGEFHPDLQLMINGLISLSFNNKPLLDHKAYIMGQVCIDKNYRGQGIFDALYQKQKEIYSNQFELFITEISTNNYRSQKAHENVGFKTIHTYKDALDEWKVVVWDWN